MKFQNHCFVVIFCLSSAKSRSYSGLYGLNNNNITNDKVHSSATTNLQTNFVHQDNATNNEVVNMNQNAVDNTYPQKTYAQVHYQTPETHKPVLDGHLSNPKANDFENRIYYAYGQNHNAAERQDTQEASSYMSYAPEVPMYAVDAPEGGYHAQPAYPSGAVKGVEEDKDKYFYYKSKYIVKLVYSLFAIHFSLFAISVLYATFVAKVGRKKRDTSEDIFGGAPGFGSSFSCVAKFLCEFEQMDNLFSEKRHKIPNQTTAQTSEEILDEEKDQRRRREQKETEKLSHRTIRRQKRQISEKRDCSKIYDTCSLNYSLFFTLFKYLM